MPPSQIGAYKLSRLLGQGGMGAVYEAVQAPIERRVALKVLKPELATDQVALTRFFNEARVVNQIEHPSLVQISDYGQAQDGTAYLVMEYLRGEPLNARLAALHGSGLRLPLVHSLQLATQIADALTAVHDKGIVHRDLKPANVMLVPDVAVAGGERVKILDFGIAKLTQSQGTGVNDLLGTPAYMSPEQCQGAGLVDDRTDVYALGVFLYEMLGGRTPFIGQGSGDYIAQHLLREPPALGELAPHLPPAVVALVHRMLLKNRMQRPSMRAVGVLLSQLTASSPVGTSFRVSLAYETTPPTGLTSADALPPLRAASASTLGQSVGQSLGQPPGQSVGLAERLWRNQGPRGKTSRAVAACAAVALLLALGIAGRAKLHRQASLPLPARPGNRVMPASGMRSADVPDLTPLPVPPPVSQPAADSPLPEAGPAVPSELAGAPEPAGASAQARELTKPRNQPDSAALPQTPPEPRPNRPTAASIRANREPASIKPALRQVPKPTARPPLEKKPAMIILD